jgi:hypothetical protein
MPICVTILRSPLASPLTGPGAADELFAAALPTLVVQRAADSSGRPDE